MIGEKKVLALIPARGGSKGIKDKNIFDIEGMPLIAYTIISALKSKYVDKVIVSTDSEKIGQIALKYGAEVPFYRPKELANDTAKTIDAVIHAIQEVEKNEVFDVLVLLQPTSPLRDEKDIDGALEKFVLYKEKSLVSVSKVRDNPLLIRRLYKEELMEKLLPDNSTVRRQEMPEFYRINGSIYINLISEITTDTSFNDNLVPYIISERNGVDIDELVDVEIVKYYLNNQE